jgi:hypothetical protein
VNVKRFYVMLFLFFYMGPIFAQVANIIDLHRNDSSGVPAAPYGIGATVTIEGIVTCGTHVYSSTNFEIYVQDATAGVNAFQFQPMPAQVSAGDRVRITGKIAHYNGLTEVSNISDVQILEQNQTVPDPLLLTCSEVKNSFSADNSEANEGRLIRINNVRVVSGTGPVYTIEDDSGQCLFYIDGDTNLEAPNGTFSVIGILKQYDSTSPYKSGYEIVPRFSSDIILGDGPVFVEQPHEIRINTSSVTFEWQTKSAASAHFFFAKRSESLPNEGLLVSDENIRHEFSLDHLQPATIYHAVVEAVDAAGTRLSKELFFSTASAESSGDMQVYFSKNVDSSVKWKEAAKAERDLSVIMIERINNAQYTIDAALYNLTHDKIFQALFLAKSRGVSVRFIHEAEYDNDNVTWLRDAGVPAISDTYGNNDGRGLMHDKFLVIDARESSTGADDWVVTGSANATYYGTLNNAENLVVINDQSLAAAYTLEFNEMWGSDSETPNASASRFSGRKIDDTPHRFNIGGIWVEQYMSPSDATENRIIDAINTANYGLFFCIFAFTSDAIENAMKDLYLYEQNFLLRGVFDAGSVNNTGSPFNAMLGEGSGAWGRPADIFSDRVSNSLHHKYVLVDAPFRDSNPMVVTGSHNWSTAAKTRNDENTLIIHDANIANQYYQEFCARYSEAGGQGDVTVDVEQNGASPQTFRLSQNYPNPFNGTTVIKLSIQELVQNKEYTLRISDVMGRTVKVLRSGSNGRQVQFRWDGKDQVGHAVSSGVYMASAIGVDQAGVIKMLYIR